MRTADHGVFQTMADRFSLIRLHGKRPIEDKWERFCHQKRRFDEIQFAPGDNAGIACGPASGVLVIDIDDVELFQSFCLRHDWNMPETRAHETGSEKPHWLYRYPTDATYGNKSLKTCGFDVRGAGGQVVAPGSVHPDTGRLYQVVHDIEPTDFPADILRQLYPSHPTEWSTIPVGKDGLIKRSLPTDIKTLIRDGAQKGERSEVIMSVLNALVRDAWSDDQIYWCFYTQKIGEKFRQVRANKDGWLQKQIAKVRSTRSTKPAAKQQQPEDQAGVDAIISQFNQDHAVVMLGGKCLVMNEIVDPLFKRPDLTFSSLADFRGYYGNRKVQIKNGNGGTKPVDAAKLWLDSPGRRQYKGIVFDPSGEVPGYFNLWRGWTVQPDPGTWDLFCDHMKNVICAGDHDIFTYLLFWMADLFRNPTERPGVSVVLRGDQGVGKGVFVSQIGKILGSHFIQVSNSTHIVGRFNSHLKDCLLCFCDEGFWAGDKTGEGALKALITEDTILIEQKGKDAFSVRNCVRLVVASNNSWVIPAGFDERRFLVLDVSSVRKGDLDYFRDVVREMDNGGRAAMLHDLLQLDPQAINLRRVPQTEALMEQKLHSLDPVGKWWFERLQDGSQFINGSGWIESPIPTEKIHGEFLDFGRRHGINYLDISSLFAKRLRRLCPEIQGPIRTRVLINSGENSYRMRLNCLVFPDLETCRKSFEKATRYNITWPEEVQDEKRSG